MSLRSYLKQMEKKGKILHVKDKAFTRFEVPFIMKKCDNKGLILLFEESKNYRTKVVATVWATRKRICEAQHKPE